MIGNRLKRKKNDPRAPSRRQNREVTEERSDIDRGQYTFRRNRTLTGSSSGKITSSTELTADLQSPRAHVHHLSTLRRTLRVYLVLVTFSALAIYFLLYQLTAMTAPQVSGVPALPQTDVSAYQKTFDGYFGGRPVERLRFLVNQRELTAYVQSYHPEIRSVRLEPGASFGETSARMVSRTPVARWSIGGRESFVDETGIVFNRNYGSTPSVEIIDNSGIQSVSGQSIASDRFLGFVGRVIAESSKRDMTVTTVTIPALTTRQVLVNIDGQRTAYRLSIDRGAGEQVEDMSRVVGYLTQNNLKPEYADLRVKGKAYYR